MNTTIKSNTTIVNRKGLENYKKGFDILFEQTLYKKNITYRRYIFNNDNLSGDKDYSSYIDYDIICELQFDGQSKFMTESGYVNTDGGVAYFPATIQKDKDRKLIPSFRPQIKDEFLYQDKWYIINNITSNQFVDMPLSMECIFSIVSTTSKNPEE